MRIALKGLTSTDWDGASFTPDEPTLIGLHAEIGIATDPGADLFQIEACNPSWLQQELRTEKLLWGRGRIIVMTFDMSVLRKAITELIVKLDDGRSWPEFALRLNRHLLWEFEDYQPWEPRSIN